MYRMSLSSLRPRFCNQRSFSSDRALRISGSPATFAGSQPEASWPALLLAGNLLRGHGSFLDFGSRRCLGLFLRGFLVYGLRRLVAHSLVVFLSWFVTRCMKTAAGSSRHNTFSLPVPQTPRRCFEQMREDPMTTMAAAERLVHHATTLEFDGTTQGAPHGSDQ